MTPATMDVELQTLGSFVCFVTLPTPPLCPLSFLHGEGPVLPCGVYTWLVLPARVTRRPPKWGRLPWAPPEPHEAGQPPTPGISDNCRWVSDRCFSGRTVRSYVPPSATGCNHGHSSLLVGVKVVRLTCGCSRGNLLPDRGVLFR